MKREEIKGYVLPDCYVAYSILNDSLPGHQMIACSGVILAGGLSSRFQGKSKALFELNGRRIIDPVIDLFQSVFKDIVLVTNTPLEYLGYDVAIASDVIPVRSSLTGIHAGLFHAQNPYVFVSACDTPFIMKELVALVLSEIRPGIDAVIPETPSGQEPLLAVYGKTALPVIERHLLRESFKITRAIRNMRVVRVPAEKVLATDPELKSFVNINTAEDLDRASALSPKT
jgi:molybdenum cofactor guanylyltransferase